MASTIPKGAKGSNQYLIRDGVTVDVGVIDRSRAGVGRSLAQALQSEAWDTVRARQFLEQAQRTAVDCLQDIERRRETPPGRRSWRTMFRRSPQTTSGDRDVIDLRDGPGTDRDRLRLLSTTELGARVDHNTAEITKIRDANAVQCWDDTDGMWRERDPDEYPTLDDHQQVVQQLSRLHTDSVACLDEIASRAEPERR